MIERRFNRRAGRAFPAAIGWGYIQRSFRVWSGFDKLGQEGNASPMPVRYEVDVDRGVVFAFYWGEVTIDDDYTLIRSIREDPRIEPQFRTLVDCTQVVTLSNAFDKTMTVVDSYRSAWAGPRTAKLALYTSEHDAIYGHLRQFLAMAGAEGRIRLFTDMAEARAWIGLPPG